MKRVFVLFCALSILLGAQARKMKDVFAAMPDSLLPALTKDNRLDCIDYVSSGMKAVVKNAFGETSTLQKLTSSYLLLDVSPSSQCEMKLLPVGKDSAAILCVIMTYRSPAAESEIRFYSPAWKQLAAQRYLSAPKWTDFQTVPAGKTADDLRQALQWTDIPFIAARLSDSNLTLKFTVECADLSAEQAADLRSFLRKEIIYKWQNGRFVLMDRQP